MVRRGAAAIPEVPEVAPAAPKVVPLPSPLPGLRLAGNAYDGIGVPDCIRLGRKAAAELIQAGAGLKV